MESLDCCGYNTWKRTGEEESERWHREKAGKQSEVPVNSGTSEHLEMAVRVDEVDGGSFTPHLRPPWAQAQDALPHCRGPPP